jgi:hypothetical protein
MEPLRLHEGPDGHLRPICHGPSPPPHHNLRPFLSQTTSNKVQHIHLRFPSALFAKAIAAALSLSSVPLTCLLPLFEGREGGGQFR